MAEAVGFWSYVRQDDDGDHGRIRALADDLREQYRIQTADELELFLDRESVEWGDAWKDRIDTAIAGTTFFIPIVTPSYLRSPECRRELLKFAREAERLGLTQLLMSVYWVEVAGLEGNPEASDDEVTQLIAKYNWQDLREERLEERDSSAYRKAVTALAKKLAERGEIARKVADAPIVVSAVQVAEQDDDDGDDETPGFIESFITTEEELPKAGALLQSITAQMEIINSMTQEFSERLEAAAAREQGMKAALVLTNRLASDISEPANRIGEDGREYSQVLAELDAAIHAQLDLIKNQTEPTSDQKEYLQQIVGLWAAAREAESGLESVLAGAEEASSFSRSLKKPLKVMRKGVLAVLDGNSIIEEWGKRAAGLLVKEEASGEDGVESQ